MTLNLTCTLWSFKSCRRVRYHWAMCLVPSSLLCTTELFPPIFILCGIATIIRLNNSALHKCWATQCLRQSYFLDYYNHCFSHYPMTILWHKWFLKVYASDLLSRILDIRRDGWVHRTCDKAREVNKKTTLWCRAYGWMFTTQSSSVHI